MKTNQTLGSVFHAGYSRLTARHSLAASLFHPPRSVLVLCLLALVGSAFAIERSAEVSRPALPPGRSQQLARPDAVPDGLSATDWSSIRQQYEQHRHQAVAVDGGHQARNPGQQWLTRFDGRGFLTRPDAGGWQWGLELQSYGFTGHERALTAPPQVSAAGQRVTYDWDAVLQEWFVNDQRGLEHGFTLKDRPVGSPSINSQPSTLNLLLGVRGGLRPEVEADGRGVRFVDAHGAAALTYTGLSVRDADGRELPARFESVASSRRRQSAHSSADLSQRRLTGVLPNSAI